MGVGVIGPVRWGTHGCRALGVPLLRHPLGRDGSDDPHQTLALLRIGDVPGVVRRWEARLVRESPDLEEVDLLGRVAVVLRVTDPGA